MIMSRALAFVGLAAITAAIPVDVHNTVGGGLKGMGCTLCEAGVTKLETYLESNTTVQELIEFADKLCADLPSGLQDECDTLVAQYMLPAIQALVNKAPPEAVCGLVGLCNATKSVLAANPISCRLCEAAVTRAEKQIDSNETVTKLIHWADQICAKAPSSVQPICGAVVDKYMGQLLGLLISKAGPKDVCVDMGQCSKSAYHVELQGDGDDACNGKYTTQSTCDAASDCTWCKSAAVPSACFEKANAKGLPPAVFECDADLDSPNTLGHPTGDYYMLRLQKCDSGSNWTIHGLWYQNADNCGGSFDESKVDDLETDLKTSWLSCPSYHSNDEELWSHEWTKHGSCSNMTEHDFFSTALRLYHNSDLTACPDGNACSICFQDDFVKCDSVGTTVCACH